MGTLGGEVTLIKKDQIFISWGLLLQERICSLQEQILSFKSSPDVGRAQLSGK